MILHEEIWNVVKNNDGNKAPGPDGFTMLFLQKCWDYEKSDICQFFKEFHNNGKLVRALKNTFLTLISKTENPTTLREYRPISLLGAFTKCWQRFWLLD